MCSLPQHGLHAGALRLFLRLALFLQQAGRLGAEAIVNRLHLGDGGLGLSLHLGGFGRLLGGYLGFPLGDGLLLGRLHAQQLLLLDECGVAFAHAHEKVPVGCELLEGRGAQKHLEHRGVALSVHAACACAQLLLQHFELGFDLLEPLARRIACSLGRRLGRQRLAVFGRCAVERFLHGVQAGERLFGFRLLLGRRVGERHARECQRAGNNCAQHCRGYSPNSVACSESMHRLSSVSRYDTPESGSKARFQPVTGERKSCPPARRFPRRPRRTWKRAPSCRRPRRCRCAGCHFPRG